MWKHDAAFLLLAPLILAACSEAAIEEKQPSVILISIDTLRADHLQPYGYERETSPYLDRLADESVVYERAYTCSAWTLPAHLTMLTGLGAHEHGIMDMEHALSEKTPLLAQRLSKIGYHTMGFYYKGLVNSRYGFDRGFDLFQDHKDADQAGLHIARALAQRDTERPFFLFIHLFDVHCGPLSSERGPVYHTPEPYENMFVEGAAEGIPAVPELMIWNRNLIETPEQKRALTGLYDGGIRYVDDKLRDWIEGWRADGTLEDTLLIITADHGEGLAQRGQTSGHGAPFVEGLRVPLIIRHPNGQRAGEREAVDVNLADLVPTVMEWTGLAPDPSIGGRSLLGPVSGSRPVIVLGGSGTYEVFIEDDIKYTLKNWKEMQGYWKIDLSEDPLELGTQLDIEEEEYQSRLAAIYASQPKRGHPPIKAAAKDQADLDFLKNMGYLGGDEDEEDE